MPVPRYLQSLYDWAHDKLVVLNLFDSRSTDAAIIRREILSTRLFLSLLFLSVSILITFCIFDVQVKTETVKLPTQAVYERLQKQYPDTLQCPCAKVSIIYTTFVQVEPLFHQVCFSDFVSQRWIDFVFEPNLRTLWPMDVRTSISHMWQLIATLCQNARNTLNDALEEFLNSPLIDSTVLSDELLRTKTQAALQLAYESASDTLWRPLRLVHRIAQANGYMTGLPLNFAFFIHDHPLEQIGNAFTSERLFLLPGSTIWCSQMRDDSCPMPGSLYLYDIWETQGVYNLSNITANETLPGIVVDFTPLQMTLTSSLECFYNQSCLNILLSAYQKTINVSTLDIFIATRFPLTTQVQQLIEEIFIEQIYNETLYKSYYLQCAPISCSYTFSRRFDWIYVLTTLISLFGGLNVALRLIAPLLINLMLFRAKKRSRQPESQPTENITMQIRLTNLSRKVQISIIKFNLFDTHSHDPFDVRFGRMRTWIFVVLLNMSIIIVTSYTFQSLAVVTETIQSPSQQQYEELQKQYPNTLNCPCTVLSIPYQDFTQIMPTFHQVCESNFAQPWWYQQLSSASGVGTPTWFMLPITNYFQTLSTLCEIATLTIASASRSFLSTVFVSAEVLPRDLFLFQTNVSIETFINSMQTEFSYTLSLIDAVLHANQYISGMLTSCGIHIINFTAYGLPIEHPLRVRPYTYSVVENSSETCYCTQGNTCHLTASPALAGYWIPQGIDFTCFTVDTVMKSSLICWYNNSCLDNVKAMFSIAHLIVAENTTVLDVQMQSRFHPSTPIETIFYELMVEEWNRSVSYDTYYRQCYPEYCTFTYNKNHNVIYTITILIAVFNGLNIILRFISFVIVKTIFKFINAANSEHSSLQSNSEEVDNQNRRVDVNHHNRCAQIQNKLITMNLFNDETSDIVTIQRQRYFTRVYLVLLLTIMLCIIIYMIVSTETVINMVSMPSKAEYEKLMVLYSDILQCPCANISVANEYFITARVDFHQVCSSDFVDEKWTNFLFGSFDWSAYDRSDIRIYGGAYFTLLSKLCTISQEIINHAIDQFLTEAFVSTQAMSERIFLSEMNATIQQFEADINNRFNSSLQLLRDITHGNTFISAYYLNWYMWIDDTNTEIEIPAYAVTLDDECSCGTRSDCIKSGGIYYFLDGPQSFSMPGLNIGCSSLETLLRSTFECLYNQTCINELNYYVANAFLAYSNTANVTVMNSTIPSRFQTNTAIEHIVNTLFIEQWHIDVSYSAFYEQCAPTYCSYTTERRGNFLHILSKILGFYGGITVCLHIVVPYVVRLWLEFRGRYSVNAVVPYI